MSIPDQHSSRAASEPPSSDGASDTSCRWGRFRAQMPVIQKWAYFDHAAVAPLPEVTQKAIHKWCREAAEQGDTAWPNWQARYERIRTTAAKLIGATREEIAFVPNTTAGISLVAEGFPWQPGDNVVTLANEFPSNLYPWMNLASREVETRRIPVDSGVPDLNRIADACDARTRIVAISWVGYASGWRVDLGEIVDLTHQAGAYLFLDAIQGLGVYPLDVELTQVDFLAADGHKWLMGPEGAGLFYCRREHLDMLRPLGVGWNSVVSRHDFSTVDLTLRPEAARYEGGTPNTVGVLGLGASLDLLVELGSASRHSDVAVRIDEVTELACAQLEAAGATIVSPRQPGHQSGIAVFDVPGQSPAEIRSRCLASGIVISCRGGGVRISPHAYNNESDIDRLVSMIRP